MIVTIDRPEVRNAVDFATAKALREAVVRFELDESVAVAVLTGAGGYFSSGFDLKALAEAPEGTINQDSPGPMGPTRIVHNKPVIAAIEGYAVAGGLELALWCDLRVASRQAVLGVFNRRFGVPLIDMGTIRLPRLIGQGRALDLILTGRPVTAEEALRIGLVERVVEPGEALAAAHKLALEIAAFPQAALRGDRMSVIFQWGADEEEAVDSEIKYGLNAIRTGEARQGARRFMEGKGRHGDKLS